MKTELFGFDILVIALSLLKFIADMTKLAKRWVTIIGAFLASLCVVLVSLQVQGVILGPETAPWVVMVLTALSAFLVTLGYGPGVVGVVNATLDLLKIHAIEKVGAPMLASVDAPNKLEVVKDLMERYHMRC